MTDSSVPDDRIDDYASRLLDREIEFADVPADLRAFVQLRSEEFAAIRDAIRVPIAIDSSLTERAVESTLRPSSRFRFRTVWASAAAAAVVLVVAIGIVTTNRSTEAPMADSSAPDMAAAVVADAATPAAQTKAIGTTTIVLEAAATPMQSPQVTESTDIPDIVALGELVSMWRTNPPALLDGPSICPLLSGFRVAAGPFTFAGQTVEIHVSDDEIRVVSTSDCAQVASIAR